MQNKIYSNHRRFKKMVIVDFIFEIQKTNTMKLIASDPNSTPKPAGQEDYKKRFHFRFILFVVASFELLRNTCNNIIFFSSLVCAQSNSVSLCRYILV